MAFVTPLPVAGNNSSYVDLSCRHGPPTVQLASRRRCRVTLCMSFDAGLSALRDAGYGDGRLPGVVYLVGAGPGDISLLTEQARTLIASADVILYDRLAGDGALELARSDATLVYVGKRAGFHTRTQDEICALLAAFARGHDVVVRLKGGDPGVYGRGGEEAAFLRARGVQVVFVPGITAASAVAANLGFPLTHRGVADSLRFVTGHARSGGGPPTLPAVDDSTTLVLYMGLAQLPHILRDLKNRGLREETPAVAVERASTPQQRVVWGTADSLPDRVVDAGLRSPTLVVVGDVVALAPGWHIVGDMNNDMDDQIALLRGLRQEDRSLLLESIRKRRVSTQN